MFLLELLQSQGRPFNDIKTLAEELLCVQLCEASIACWSMGLRKGVMLGLGDQGGPDSASISYTKPGGCARALSAEGTFQTFSCQKYILSQSV